MRRETITEAWKAEGARGKLQDSAGNRGPNPRALHGFQMWRSQSVDQRQGSEYTVQRNESAEKGVKVFRAKSWVIKMYTSEEKNHQRCGRRHRMVSTRERKAKDQKVSPGMEQKSIKASFIHE